ncbi:MAG: hypothetical protein AB7I42_10525 [Bradyrhizobium sp.]|uniref:hypothetical protein n=1 Tax=Bradyrhizobium sp. TaxID=376 RepID=UPI002A29F99B|nr:hypothetical protein [Bradyrhizobium sp.]
MGFLVLFVLVCVVQIAAASIMALRQARLHRWLSATGIICGTAAVFASWYFWWDPFLPAAVNAFFFSIVVLLTAYSFTSRWKALAILLLGLVVPVAYAWWGWLLLPTKSLPAFFGFVRVVGEMELLLGPIVCGLAAGEILGMLDSRLIQQRKIPLIVDIK